MNIAPPARWQQIEALFAEALERPTAERAGLLGSACADDPALRAELDRLLDADPERRRPDAVANRGVAHAPAGRRSETRQILATLDTVAARAPVSAFHRAVIHACPGEHEPALAQLAQAVEEPTWHMRMLKVEPIFDPVRGHPRFRALLETVGLSL